MPDRRSASTRRLAPVALVAVIAVAACTSAGPAAPTTTGAETVGCLGQASVARRDLPYRRLEGVQPRLVSLDLYRPRLDPRCAPPPVVVYVHGGGFTIGDKGNAVADKVELFTSQGWAFASVNYRLSVPVGAPAVRYPTHAQDVAAALGWIGEHASEHDLDPDRIVLMGHSSGAFLAALVSTDSSFLDAAGVGISSIRCTAALDTEYDVPAAIDEGANLEELYRNAFGDDPATWRRGSPAEHTSPGRDRPSFLLFTRGAPRRIAQSRSFAARLVTGGTPARVVDVTPLDHEGVNRAVGAPGDRLVTPPLLAFLRTCLGPR